MMKGFNVHGTFYTKNNLSIPTESEVPFDNFQNVNGLVWNPSGSNPEQIQVLEDGIFKIVFLANVNTPAQYTIFVNGLSLDYTTQGTNKGATQFSVRGLVPLNKNDIITIRNHTSANGSTIIASGAGGSQPTIAALCLIYKIAPLTKPSMDECKMSHCEKYYEKFKQYLLHNHCLQLTGASTNSSVSSDNTQNLVLNDSLVWSYTHLQHNVMHTQGMPTFTIHEDGEYFLLADALFNESSQLTLFVNNMPDASTISGRDSGGGRLLIRQILSLKKGDVLSLVNYSSYATSLSTAVNAGGTKVGQNVRFMVFKMSPNMECPKPCPPKPEPKKDKKDDKKPKK